MNPKKQQLVLDLATGRLTHGEFLTQFEGTSDANQLISKLLEESFTRRIPDDVEYALIVGFSFGFSKAHVEVLCRLAGADWHFKHEDVITALGNIGDDRAIDALYRATQDVPKYLAFDESRALAVKAIWAIGKIAGRAAEEKLHLLSESDEPNLRDLALKQIEQRPNT